MKLLTLLTPFVLVALLAGCTPCPTIKPYQGMTDSMAKVVDDINANNSKVPTLWAHHFYEADVVDDKHNNRHVSGDGVLLYTTPMSMRLKANSVVGTVFEIGSNSKTFWLKLGPDAGDTMWWGSYDNFARMNPDDAQIPIRPDMVLDVLGIATINTNFNALPAPTMRFDPYADAYVFVWNGRLPDRWVALREVWYDRTTKLPKLVLLYDMKGRVVLRGEFNNPKYDIDGRPKLEMKYYRQVATPGLPKAQWPWIPSNYNLFFPENGSHLVFTLDEAELKKEGLPSIPQPRSFIMPDPAAVDVNHVIEVR